MRFRPPAPIETLKLFGCRIIHEEDVRTLLQNNGATLRKLDLNGALNTVNIEEAEIRALCPSLEELDARGRARKILAELDHVFGGSRSATPSSANALSACATASTPRRTTARCQLPVRT